MKKHKKIKKIFVVRAGIWNNDILVSIGMKREEIIAHVESQYKKNLYQKYILEFAKTLPPDRPDNGWCYSSDEHGFIILSICEMDGCWRNYETLIHECCHAAREILKSKSAESEEEAFAHTVEYLFHEIRINL